VCLQRSSLPLSLSLQCGRASWCGASAWPQHERDTTWRPKRPSMWRRNDADGLITSGPARQGKHKWLPVDLAPLSQSCGRCLLVVSRNCHLQPPPGRCLR
jgi:hypothetical protein